MLATEVAEVRSALTITQTQLALLVGVHPITVSKWERNELSPNAHQAALLRTFGRAAKREPGIGALVVGLLVGAGLGYALYRLLRAAFNDGGEA